jgi:hypothetical protein
MCTDQIGFVAVDIVTKKKKWEPVSQAAGASKKTKAVPAVVASTRKDLRALCPSNLMPKATPRINWDEGEAL